MSGIDVIKNPNAAITEGGLGGTINLKTADPLLSARRPDPRRRVPRIDGAAPGRPRRPTAPWWVPTRSMIGWHSAPASPTTMRRRTPRNTRTANRNALARSPTRRPDPTRARSRPPASRTLPKYYIEPQLGYFTDIEDETKEYGASFDVALKVTDSITSNFLWFYSRENETDDQLLRQGVVQRPGRVGRETDVPGTALPGIDPTQPYSIDGNGVVQNAHVQCQRRRNRNALSRQHLRGQQFSMGHEVRQRRPAARHSSMPPLRTRTSNLQAAQADVEHGLYTHQCRRGDLAGGAGLQQRLRRPAPMPPAATAMNSPTPMAAPPACLR